MKKYQIFLISIIIISFQTNAQIKIGNNGIGVTIGSKNNFTGRFNPNFFVKQKKEIGFELQYNHSLYSEEYNRLYFGIGFGHIWVNLHEINNGFLSTDYVVSRVYLPLGCEYFPFNDNNKISFQLETGPQLNFSKLELDPGRKMNYFYNLRGILEINYYFGNRRNTRY